VCERGKEFLIGAGVKRGGDGLAPRSSKLGHLKGGRAESTEGIGEEMTMR